MLGSKHASAADSTTVQDCRQQAGRCSDRVDAASMCACVCACVRVVVCLCVCVRVSCACVCVRVMCACAICVCHVLCAYVWGCRVVVVLVVAGGGVGLPASHPRRLPTQSFQHRWHSQPIRHRRTAAVAGSKAGRACTCAYAGRVQRQAGRQRPDRRGRLLRGRRGGLDRCSRGRRKQPAPQRSRVEVVRACRAHRCTNREGESCGACAWLPGGWGW